MDSKNLQIDSNSLGPVKQNRRQEIAPCEKRVVTLLDRLKQIAENEPSKWWPTLAEEAKRDYWIFLRIVLDYRFLDPWDHGEEVVHFVQSCVDQNEPGLVLAPRGAAKTGVVTVPLLPWLLARDPSLTGIITNVREDKASEFARMASKIITECQNYRSCYPHLLPTDKWGESGYHLQQRRAPGGGVLGRVDPNIGSYGVGGNIVGAHVRAILHDDLINDKTYMSPLERGKAAAFLKESLNCLDPEGTFMCCATRWHFDDVYGKLENGDILIDGKRCRVFKRAAERYVLDDNGEPVVEVFNPRRTYVDLRGSRQSVGYTEEALRGFKVNLGSLYSALYMNNPISDSDRMISVETINQFISFNQPLGPLFRLGVEIVSTAETFWQAILTSMRDEKKMFSVERIRPKASNRGIEKDARIRAIIGPLAAEGRLFIRDDLWTREGSIGQEIREFDRGTDDLLDALTYAILRSPKWEEGRQIRPYIAVDPAFTKGEQSNFTAILVGCWWRDDFYVLDCTRYKVQKTELNIAQIFKMADKYLEGTGEIFSTRPTQEGRFRSHGNQTSIRRVPKVEWTLPRTIDAISDGDEHGKPESRKDRRPVQGLGGFRR